MSKKDSRQSTTMQEVPIVRYQEGSLWEVNDWVIREEPLEIWNQGHCLTRTVRLPGQDEDLALGWCLSEGLISQREDLVYIQKTQQEQVTCLELALDNTARSSLDKEQAHPCSGTGNPGKNANLSVRFGQAVSVDVLFRAREAVVSGQELFQATGGTHCAAIFALGLRLLALAEDVGRHNALDKIIGRTLGVNLTQGIIVVISSRLNAEMVSKAIQAGIPILAGVSAPTQHGVDLAAQAGMTLIGFLRPGRFNVYTHAWRIRP
ncbi:MAG: formate dehydrogenase accessory sulfurtransferase FdhD [Desulfovermiculus sp.]